MKSYGEVGEGLPSQIHVCCLSEGVEDGVGEECGSHLTQLKWATDMEAKGKQDNGQSHYCSY